MSDFDPLDLPAAIAWLDGHTNLEKTGPVANAPAGISDPERRIRNLHALMGMMGEPQDLYPTIHLTGTNGKTSTSRILTSLLLAQGLRTGTYTSPHLEFLNERINVNGEPIGDEDLAEVLYAVALVEPMIEERVSYFEILTAAAYRHFADSPVDVGVIEVGVGGRYDATNIINSTVAVITNIGLDHTGYLGTTRESVADNKADIIKAGATAVIGEPDQQFLSTWQARNPKITALFDRDFGLDKNEVAIGGRLLDIRTPSTSYEDVFLGLHGSYQGRNAAIAVTAAEAFFEAPLHEDVVRAGLGAATSPGRMEIVHRQPLVVLDGAHNEAGARALAETLTEEFQASERRILVTGMLRGHEPSEMLPALDPSKFALIVATQPESPRAIAATDIEAVAKELGVACVVVPSVAEAVDYAIDQAEDEDLILVTGSLYVVGEARSAVRRRTEVH